MLKHNGRGNIAWRVVLALAGVALLLGGLAYSTGSDISLLNPKGQIAREQLRLIKSIVAVFLLVAIPTLTLLYSFAWKYRDTNQKPKRNLDPSHSKFFAPSMWLIPIAILIVLTSVMWPATHKLDPHKAIDSNIKPLTIQVVALRSKWLFIYPQQGIATINFVQIPVDTPVQFDLTADDAPMNSFWIPHLGGQLYAMTGHQNRLNLIADTLGDYNGGAAEINGPGFAGMKFTARASSSQDFDQWVSYAQEVPGVLDSAEYKKLLVPSENNPVAFYSAVNKTLYAKVLSKYSASHDKHMEQP